MYKLESIHPKQNQKQIMHESNKLCMLQTRRKATIQFYHCQQFHFAKAFQLHKLPSVTYISNIISN